MELTTFLKQVFIFTECKWGESLIKDTRFNHLVKKYVTVSKP